MSVTAASVSLRMPPCGTHFMHLCGQSASAYHRALMPELPGQFRRRDDSSGYWYVCLVHLYQVSWFGPVCRGQELWAIGKNC